MIPLSSAVSVSRAPRHAAMQVLRPIPGGRRSSEGGLHLILPPLGALGWVVSCAVTALGAWFGAGRGAGVPGCRASRGGMCGRSSMRLSRLKRREAMLGILISPTSSSTLMQQVLRSRVRRRRKCIESIYYSYAQSTLARLSPTLWHIMEKRSATRVCVSDHSVANRDARPSATSSAVTQPMWRRPL